jgi:hypothetical protein
VTTLHDDEIEARLRVLFDAVARDTDTDAPAVAFLGHQPAVRVRTRARAQWAFAAAFVVAVMIAGLAALASVDRSSGGPAASVPAQHTTHVATRSGDLTLELPAGWHETSIPPGEVPSAALAVGTTTKRPSCEGRPSVSARQWLIIYDFTDVIASGQPLPTDRPLVLDPFAQARLSEARDRPSDFREVGLRPPGAVDRSGTCGTNGETLDVYFRDSGRFLVARVVAPHVLGVNSDESDERALRRALPILNSLQVRAVDGQGR